MQRRYGRAFDKVVQTIKTEILPILLPKKMVRATRDGASHAILWFALFYATICWSGQVRLKKELIREAFEYAVVFVSTQTLHRYPYDAGVEHACPVSPPGGGGFTRAKNHYLQSTSPPRPRFISVVHVWLVLPPATTLTGTAPPGRCVGGLRGTRTAVRASSGEGHGV